VGDGRGGLKGVGVGAGRMASVLCVLWCCLGLYLSCCLVITIGPVNCPDLERPSPVM